MRRKLFFGLVMLLVSLMLTAGCNKTEKHVHSKEDTSQTTPTEPAPVPEGTPKY